MRDNSLLHKVVADLLCPQNTPRKGRDENFANRRGKVTIKINGFSVLDFADFPIWRGKQKKCLIFQSLHNRDLLFTADNCTTKKVKTIDQSFPGEQR